MAFKDEVGSLDRIASAVETISGGKEIQTPTQSDKDKVLSVNAQGKYALETPSGGGGSLVVHIVNEENPPILDKTAGEIYSAYSEGKNVVCIATRSHLTSCFNLTNATFDSKTSDYSFEFKDSSGKTCFAANGSDVYPSLDSIIQNKIEVDFENDGEGNYVGNVEASEIYGAFENGIPVNFRIPIEGIYFIGRVISAIQRANDSYYFGTISDTTEYSTFDFEASDGDSYPVWIQPG